MKLPSPTLTLTPTPANTSLTFILYLQSCLSPAQVSPLYLTNGQQRRSSQKTTSAFLTRLKFEFSLSLSLQSAMEEVSVLVDPETEFLASKKESGNEWELFKENVRPLKRGRNASLLNQSLKSHSDPILKKSLLQNRRSYLFFFSILGSSSIAQETSNSFVCVFFLI